jgi:hypothetical protein
MMASGPGQLAKDNNNNSEPGETTSLSPSTLHNVHYRRFGDGLERAKNACFCPVSRKLANITYLGERLGETKLARQERLDRARWAKSLPFDPDIRNHLRNHKTTRMITPETSRLAAIKDSRSGINTMAETARGLSVSRSRRFTGRDRQDK